MIVVVSKDKQNLAVQKNIMDQDFTGEFAIYRSLSCIHQYLAAPIKDCGYAPGITITNELVQ